MIMTSGEFVTLILFFASGTGGGFNSEVRIMKMMSNTNSTSVNGVMLMVDMTSSSGLEPMTDMRAPPLLGHEADVIVAGRARCVQNLDDRVVARVLVRQQRHVGGVPLVRVALVKRDRVRHRVVKVGHGNRLAIDIDGVLRSHLDLDLMLQLLLRDVLRSGVLLGELLLEAGRRSERGQ